MLENQYKCEQPCVALKVAICARLTGCEGRFLGCLKDCFDYELVWKTKGQRYVEDRGIRARVSHCNSCSLSDMTNSIIEKRKDSLNIRHKRATELVDFVKARRRNALKAISKS